MQQNFNSLIGAGQFSGVWRRRPFVSFSLHALAVQMTERWERQGNEHVFIRAKHARAYVRVWESGRRGGGCERERVASVSRQLSRVEATEQVLCIVLLCETSTAILIA